MTFTLTVETLDPKTFTDHQEIFLTDHVERVDYHLYFFRVFGENDFVKSLVKNLLCEFIADDDVKHVGLDAQKA